MSHHPLAVHLLREGLTESVHVCEVVVADERGRALMVAGQGSIPVFARSTLKPFQALAALSVGARERYQLGDKDLAIMCSSHAGTMMHARQVFRLLWRAELEPDALVCPIPPGADSPLLHNCSGKHAGMLLAARLQNWTLHDYAHRHHPVQALVRSHLGDLLKMPAEEFLAARDDCGVPTYQVQLSQLATLYGHLAAGRRADLELLLRAMIHEPVLVAGDGRFDTELMRLSRGAVVSKSGAEGVQCLGRVGEGMGMAIKVRDGSSRAKYAVALALLKQMGWIPVGVFDLLAEQFLQVGPYTRLEVEGELNFS